MKRVAIFSSHNGSGYDAIHEAIEQNRLNATVVFVLTNNTNANVLLKAKQNNVPSYLINATTHKEPDSAIYELLIRHKCTHIFLSGYMKKISPKLTNNFFIINSHPSLLPKYGGSGMYGRRVHQAVIQNKEEHSGVTIHQVNEAYDEGKIVLQKELKLAPNESVDSLESRIKELEKVAIIEALIQCLN